MSSELIAMSIKGLMLDPVSNSPIVVLKDDDEKFFLPIWVGIFEANAIALQLENITTPRPMTHDLLRNMIAELERARDPHRHQRPPRLHVLRPDPPAIGAGSEHMLEVDARPSDAIALALRTEAPIFVAQSVLDQAQTITPDGEDSEEKTKKWFENLSPEDLGKYKM